MGYGAVRGARGLLWVLLFIGVAGAQEVRVGGSSTLYPASTTFAALVEERIPAATIEVTFEGTGGGFDLLCKGAAEVIGASRLATAEEKGACAAAGIEFVAFPVALDAVMLVVPEQNDWVSCLNMDEVRRLWSGGEEGVDRWSELRPEWPDREIEFHAPGVASGTYDYWNQQVLGPGATMRTDYYPSEDDRQLAQRTASNPDAISFFGRAQLELTQSGLRAVAIDDGHGCVDPAAVGQSGVWPFVRPLFLYVSAAAAAPAAEPQQVISTLVEALLSPEGQVRLSNAGYLPLEEQVRREALARFRDRLVGPLASDYAGQSLLRRLSGGWTQRQVDLQGRLLALEREVQAVGGVHGGLDTLVQDPLDGSRSGIYDSP